MEDKWHIISVDFDRTLLTIDSGREYLRYFATIRLRFFGVLRLFCIISKSKFRKKILEDLQHCRAKRPKRYNQFVKHLIGKVNLPLLQFILSIEPTNHLIIINSASDQTLIADFGKEFGLTEFIGSQSRNLNYGEKKVENLIERYPQREYQYCTGISDNVEDKVWSKYFETFVFYDSNTNFECIKGKEATKCF